MEHGFYHPDVGYWQTVSDPTAETLAAYPAGTVEVPLKPGDNSDWVDGEWVSVPVAAPTKAAQEAARKAAYKAETDPLFFQWQAGEGTEADWLAKRQEIRDRYPYPTE
jgi:hypothetical protein